MTDKIGALFQRETKYRRGQPASGRSCRTAKPEAYKSYPGAKRVELPSPLTAGGNTLWEAIRTRRSVREYMAASIPFSSLSQILWAAQGTTAEFEGCELRAAPSAGALYPIETYVAVHDVEGLEPGLYHYDVRGHALEILRAGDIRKKTAAVALEQHFAAQAAFVLIWTAVFSRSRWKYGERAYRYVYLDSGHIAQNAALAAAALGLGSCPIAALFDDEVNALIGADGEEESVIYMTAVGRPEAG